MSIVGRLTVGAILAGTGVWYEAPAWAAVIGGLIQEVESEIKNGIPVLMDVPLLGGLFRFSNTTTKKRELIIFVTPRIVGEVVDQTGDLSMQ